MAGHENKTNKQTNKTTPVKKQLTFKHGKLILGLNAY